MSKRILDLKGHIFVDWTVVSLHGTKKGKAYWYCICKCGVERIVKSIHLTQSRSTGCGCAAKQRLANIARTHGMTGTDEHRIWRGIKQRCLNSRAITYQNYGARGISISDEWIAFEKFYEDMGPRPSKKHSVERIDNEKGYSKENCRWATASEQLRNTRRNRIFTHDGKTMFLTDWAKEIGITQQALQGRLKNWPLERALSEAPNVRFKR